MSSCAVSQYKHVLLTRTQDTDQLTFPTATHLNSFPSQQLLLSSVNPLISQSSQLTVNPLLACGIY